MQRLRELASQLGTLYDEMTAVFAGFQQDSGLTCKPGCGACCNNPHVEASVLEMLPLALSLYDTGRAVEVLEALEGYSGFACFHFVRQSLDGAAGYCSVYAMRPGLCRMFGAAGVRDKHGQARLSICRIIKAEQPGASARAATRLMQHPAPDMLLYKARLQQLDFTLGRQDLPINQALRTALERVLFTASLGDNEAAGQVA